MRAIAFVAILLGMWAFVSLVIGEGVARDGLGWLVPTLPAISTMAVVVFWGVRDAVRRRVGR